jgi:hypothetical protein
VTDVNEVQRFTDAVMIMLKEDQASGQIPADLLSLDELDNYADIDDYYRRLRLFSGGHDMAELRSAVGEEIGRRLAAAQGGPWHVIWRAAGGEMRDVGRAVGYANQGEAQAVGREYVHAHGGGFHLRRA